MGQDGNHEHRQSHQQQTSQKHLDELTDRTGVGVCIFDHLVDGQSKGDQANRNQIGDRPVRVKQVHLVLSFYRNGMPLTQ